MKQKIIQKLIFNKRMYFKELIYLMVKGLLIGKVCHPNNITAAKACNDSQLVEHRKDNKRVFMVGNSFIKHLNGYAIGGKTGNCTVYVCLRKAISRCKSKVYGRLCHTYNTR